MASHILTFSIMVSVLTGYSGCTVLFSVAGGLLSIVFTIPRRLESLSFLSSISFASVLGAVFVSMVGASFNKTSPIQTSLPPTFHDIVVAIANVVFAYAGHVAFFAFFSELRDVKDYPRALALLQVSEVTLYTVTAIVLYLLVGKDIASPSLNSVSPLFRKISYGIAIPTVGSPTKVVLPCRSTDRIDCDSRCRQRPCRGEINILADVSRQQCHALTFLRCNIPMDRCMRDAMVFSLGSSGKHTGFQRYLGAYGKFLGQMGNNEKENIPPWARKQLTPILQSSLFASWFTFSLPGVFWLYLNVPGRPLSWKQTILIGFNCINVINGLVIVSWIYSCHWLTN